MIMMWIEAKSNHCFFFSFTLSMFLDLPIIFVFTFSRIFFLGISKWEEAYLDRIALCTFSVLFRSSFQRFYFSSIASNMPPCSKYENSRVVSIHFSWLEKREKWNSSLRSWSPTKKKVVNQANICFYLMGFNIFKTTEWLVVIVIIVFYYSCFVPVLMSIEKYLLEFVFLWKCN